jgi:hypothetical protein
MRRLLAPLMAASLLTVLAMATPFAVPTAAVAAAPQVAAGVCPNSPPYPPGPDATVEVNTTIPHVGDTLQVSGIEYCPNEDVDITIAGQHVGTGHTDNNGSFGPQQVITPGPPGPQQLCGIGASGLPTDRDCLTLHVQGTGRSSPAPPGSNGGGTAFTGVQIALFGLIALVLVVGGVVVTTLGRNRRPERA